MIPVQGVPRRMDFKRPLGLSTTAMSSTSHPTLSILSPESKVRRNLFIILFSIIVMLIVVIAFLSFFLAVSLRAESESSGGFFSNSNSPRPGGSLANLKDTTVCTSKSCIKAANLILQNMDESQDPCENFYEFTCGNYLKHNRLREDQSKLDEFSMLRDRVSYLVSDLLSEPVSSDDIPPVAYAKKLYTSCVDELTIEERGFSVFLNMIKDEFGGWPILHSPPTKSNITTAKKRAEGAAAVVKKFIKFGKVGSTLPFEIYVSPNPKDPKRNILRISQTEWFFNKEYLFDEKVMIAYHNLMHSIIQAFNVDNRNITSQIDKIFELERKFAFLQLDEEERRNSTYTYMSLKELNYSIPLIDWVEIIEGLFVDIDNTTINEEETILIDDFKYLVDASKLYSYLKLHTPTDFENFLVWLYVKDLIPFLPRFFQEIKLEFDKVYEGNSIKPSRSLSCSNFVNSKMEHAVGRLYVSRYFNGTSKLEAVNMTNNLLAAFKEMLNETDWMDEQSKLVALEKVDFIDTKIGYSEDIYNDTYLMELYKNFNFSETKLIENYLNLEKLIVKYELSQLRKDQNPKQYALRLLWISGPAVVNAFYSPTSNQICFPAGILQPPFYDSSYPKYLNYGAIGTVIGHEITHGFDDMGRLYDKDGVFSNHDGIGLWTNKTIENYKIKAQCIVDQYNAYHVKQVNKSLNGLNTQGENIADNGGVKQAFRAYKKWLIGDDKNKKRSVDEQRLPGLEKFTSEQMFFITYGQLWCGKTRDQAMIHTILNDPHSPGEFRIIGATSNMEEFSETFSCKKDQKNNPTKKCSVW